MEKLLVLTTCCLLVAASVPDKHDISVLKEEYTQQMFSQFGKRSLQVGPRIVHGGILASFNSGSVIAPNGNGLPEVMMLHSNLQHRLGWGGGEPPRNQYGPPPGSPPKQQYGPPPSPNQQYGPPPAPNQQYGPPPPPPNQQYGPPPAPNQQYGPPPAPNQQYGPPPAPNQQYGPPPAPNQQYGPPAASPNQQYGPPPAPNQQYGPPPAPNQQYGPPPAPPNQQYGPPPAPNQQYGPPPAPNQQYGPPPAPPNQQYGSPAAPAPPNQNYGAPAPTPSQEYGAPAPPSQPSQEYGPPNNAKDTLRVNQGSFGGHIENFKTSDVKTSSGYSNSQSDYPTIKETTFLSNLNSILDAGDKTRPSSSSSSSSSDSSKIFKHVYIHTPTDDFEEQSLEPRVIRPNKKQDTHYQIIFVKAPAPPQQPPTEIELPPPPKRKTLVYVLVKKPEKPAEIKFRQPPPTQPSKPEVFFIKYKNSLKSQKDKISSQIISNQDSSNDIEDDSGYSLDSQSLSQVGSSGGVDDLMQSLLQKIRDRDSVGYPNAEYRAPPIMLNPNDEPMSFAVYDRVRNEKVPAVTNGAVGGILPSGSELVSVIAQRRRTGKNVPGSHYTAPGSQPFDRPSARMIDGEFVSPANDILILRRKQHYPTGDR